MKEIRFVLDGPVGHDSGRFVEVENENGESINIGEWRQDGNYWYLAIPYCADRLVDKEICRMNEQIAALTAENKRLRERLRAAEDVVSHLVIWGAAPIGALAALVEKAMTLRMRDKETLCIPSAVKEALQGGEVKDE